MDFSNRLKNVRILSVLDLAWEKNDLFVPARQYHSLSFRTRGGASFTDGDRVARVEEGGLLYMPAGVGYGLKSETNRLIAINFDADFDGAYTPVDFEIMMPVDAALMENAFLSMYEAWTRKKPGYYFRTLSSFYKILALIEREKYKTASSDSYAKIKRSVEYLHAHYTDTDIQISALAEMSKMSDTYFRRLFSEVFGERPLDYLNRLRIGYACELLVSGYYSAADVALRSGFSDPKYFSTVFKRVMKKTPTEFKNKSIG
jgi:AraC-like DNA-binding protein